MKPNKSGAGENNSQAVPDSVRTVGELFRYARTLLSDAALNSPDADSRALFHAATGFGAADVIFRGDEEYTVQSGPEAQAGRAKLAELLARRVTREPLQHILGTAPMMGLELAVGPGVFVPRPETELLAQWAIDRARELVAGSVVKPKVVDLCTGSGALALAVADAVREAEVVAVELSAQARAWAARNIEAYGDGRVHLVAGDVTDAALIEGAPELARWAGDVDIVVTNPPYVPEAAAAQVDPEVLADPHFAVFGGEDGLDVIRPMMTLVDGLLPPGGVLGIEHDDSSGADVSRLLTDHWHYAEVRVHRDYAERDRFTTARKGLSAWTA